ncbi:MAG: BolA protein [Pelagibacterales bacterium]|nr:BolA protein [Pelagibacterales bacterium]
MDINELILIVKIKIKNNILLQDITVEDKTFLHKKHKNHQNGKFHIKITIKSKELKEINKIDSTKKIYKILDKEINETIHSLQILIN